MKIKIGFLPILTLLFIVLKLTGCIQWSWPWVLSPMIFQLGLVLILMIVVGIIDVIGQLK